MANLYGVLGVARHADAAKIKSEFRTLAKGCHPDLHPGNARAEQRFKEIHQAYAVLRDPVARAAYDRELARRHACWQGQLRAAATTMAATFMFTVSSGLLVAAWMRAGGLL
jgi:DnaJ-class molecular chaperone